MSIGYAFSEFLPGLLERERNTTVKKSPSIKQTQNLAGPCSQSQQNNQRMQALSLKMCRLNNCEK